MQLDQFHYAIEIAKCGSFTQAAKNLFISQPSLTIAIKKLEKDLGFSLFTRSSKGIQVTPLGAKALDIMQQILILTENLNEISSSSQEKTSTLQLTVFPTLYDLLYDSPFQKNIQQNSNIDLEIIEQTSNNILQEMKNGSLDLAINGSPSPIYHDLCSSPKNNKIATQIFYEEPFSLFLPKDHPLLSKEKIYITDLKKENLLCFNEHLKSNYPNMLEGYNFSFNKLITFHRRTSLNKALYLGQGITIMAKSYRHSIDDSISLRNIEDFSNTYIHYLIYNKRHIFTKLESDVLDLIATFYMSL